MSLFDQCVGAGLFNDAKIPKIDGTKFSNYFFTENDKEDWDLLVDFPNCFPPYPEMWIEFKAPEKIVSCVEGVVIWADYNRPTHWGWHIKMFHPEHMPDLIKDPELVGKSDSERMISCFLYEKYKDLTIPSQASFALMLCFNEQGRPCPLYGTGKTVGIIGSDKLLKSISEKDQKDLLGMYLTFFEPALLAISYMNNPEGNDRLQGEKLCQIS